ncbi:Wax ester synthase/diacylglycerol acyltransferase 1 [Cardamine amara subsp. amara]|uniref:Wax ester synthase/diacylglycerol acyltransferase 1 n=1 Tax=Cardamine amara subsp. amara TaxID=228776 RepID=A0ABD1A2C8_CARAN
MANEEVEAVPMEPLSPITQLLNVPSLFIVITFGVKTKCNPSAIVEGIKNTLIKAPHFSCKQVVDSKTKGELVWIPVNVLVEDHVVVPDLDYPNIENPDQFIEDYSSSMANTPMDMSKPLWEFHILNIKTSNAESVFMAKIHHAIGDGTSLVSLLLACARKTSDPDALISTTTTTTKPIGSTTSAWWLVAMFWFMIRVTFITFVEVLLSLLTICFLRDTKNPLMVNPNSVRSWKVIHRTICFDDVKFVKNAMNMKVNDVLIGMTQAGLSKYLSTKYDGYTVAQKKRILEKIRIRGAVAVNLRPATKIEDLANMMAKGSKCRWGNFVSAVIFPLWIKSENDPLKYLRRAKAMMDRKKVSLEAFIFYGIMKYTLKILGGKAVQAIGDRIFGHTTMTISNVKGPDEEISVFGHPISYIAGSSFIGSHAVIINFVSYINMMVINLSVDTTTIPDPYQLCDDMVESLEIFKSTIHEKGFHKTEV